MKYNYTFGANNPDIQERMNSKQFELSEKLMDIRFELSLSIKEIAEILDIKIEYYLALEHGFTDIDIESYHHVLNLMENYKSLVAMDSSQKPMHFITDTGELNNKPTWNIAVNSNQDRINFEVGDGKWLLKAS